MDARVSSASNVPISDSQHATQANHHHHPRTRYDPTIEDSYSITRTIDGTPHHLSITDTAGQEEYRSVWASSPSATTHSDAFLLVYDITAPSTLHALSHFAGLIDAETDTRLDRGGVPPVRMVAGNKCDLQKLRKVSAREGLEWARKRQCGFMETSAREMVNVEETFALMVRRVVEARRAHAERDAEVVVGHAVAKTEPLTPLAEDEKADPLGEGRFPVVGIMGRDDVRGGKRRGGGFWKSLRCW